MKKICLLFPVAFLVVFAILGFEDYDTYKGFSLKKFESALALVPSATFRMGVCEGDLDYIPADPCRQ